MVIAAWRPAAAALILAGAVPVGCAPLAVNPAHPDSHEAASRALALMSAQPVAPTRPILVLGGYMDPGFAAGSLERALRASCGPSAEIVAVSFMDCTSMEQCRDRVLASTAPIVDAHPEATFDVVANSMGGIVARYAALSPDRRRECGLPESRRDRSLRIHHLYTIGTPHRGALMAEGAFGSPLTRQLRQGSDLLRCLDTALPGCGYGMTCFARIGDSVVGVDRCAPDGVDLIWLDTPPLELAHVDAHRDPRIVRMIVAGIRSGQ